MREVCVLSIGEADSRRIVAQALEKLEVDRTTRIAEMTHASFIIPIDAKNANRTHDLEQQALARMTTILRAEPRCLTVRKAGTDTVRITCTLYPQGDESVDYREPNHDRSGNEAS